MSALSLSSIDVATKKSRKSDLPPLFYYMEMGDWEKATDQVRKHPREIRTWATLRTKSMAEDGTKVSSTRRLALHHACFKMRSAGSSPPTGRSSEDPFVEVCRFILMLIRLYSDAAEQRESRHGCLPLHLAAFASCAPRIVAEQESSSPLGTHVSRTSPPRGHCANISGSLLVRPGLVSNRSLSDATAATLDTAHTNLSAVHAEEAYTGEIGDKEIRRSKAKRPVDPNVSVSSRCNILINPKREEMAVQVINALLDAYPKGVRVDSEGGRLPLHTACAGRATPRVISTLVTAYSAAARHRNKDGFLPLHLAAHWGVSHPNAAITLLKAYPDATLGRNRWERTPLEEALCMAGENGRPHQAALVRALRKHPSFWTRPPAGLFSSASTSTSTPKACSISKTGCNKDGTSTAVDVDESLPSNESSTHEEINLFNGYGDLLQQGERLDFGGCGHEVELPQSEEGVYGQGRGMISRLSPRSLIGKKVVPPPEKDPLITSENTLSSLIQERRWDSVLLRLKTNPIEAEEELEVLTRGGFIATAGMTALHYACERNPPVEVVESLIEAHPVAVLTRTMPGGSLPLHVACTWYNSPGVVGSLLKADHGACQISDELGNIPLHSACFSGADVLVIESLLSNDGKSVLARNHQGSRPIDICKRLRHENRKAVMALLTLMKEEVLAHHRRSRSSGTWSEVAQEAAKLNDIHGTPVRSSASFNGMERDSDLVLDDQAVGVEVSYQGRDNQELVWI